MLQVKQSVEVMKKEKTKLKSQQTKLVEEMIDPEKKRKMRREFLKNIERAKQACRHYELCKEIPLFMRSPLRR